MSILELTEGKVQLLTHAEAFNIYIQGAHCGMVNIVENGPSDLSSNPGQGWLHFT